MISKLSSILQLKMFGFENFVFIMLETGKNKSGLKVTYGPVD